MSGVQPTPAVVVEDGVATISQVSPKLFLETAPEGAYTVGRTVDYETVFEFEMHVQRMVTSIALMDKDGKHDIQDKIWHAKAMDKVTDSAFIRDYMKTMMRKAIIYFTETSSIKVPELKVMQVIPYPLIRPVRTDGEEVSFSMTTYVCPLPDIPQPPVKVQSAIKSRTNPNAKDSAWIRERKALNDAKPEDVNEILLLSSKGDISEGMSSNFFCMLRGELYTADGEGVLRGTVRALVLKVCEDLGIRVRHECPNITEASDWSGCFVTSTSRLVLPIDSLECPTDDTLGSGKVIEYGECKQVDSIRREVKAHIRESCVQVL